MPEINHWLKAIYKIRTMAGGPLCIELRMYVFFRDGVASSWLLSKCMNARLVEVEEVVAVQSSGGTVEGAMQPGPNFKVVWL